MSGETTVVFTECPVIDIFIAVQESAQMFDIIRDSRTTDLARVFGRSLKDIYAVFRTQISTKNNNWASNYEKKLKQYQKSIDKLNEIFAERS